MWYILVQNIIIISSLRRHLLLVDVVIEIPFLHLCLIYYCDFNSYIQGKFTLILYVLDKKMYEYGIYVKMNRDFACNGPHIQIPSISCLDKTNIRWKRTTKYIHVKTNFMLMLHAR